jgi:hypothetical protein
MENIKKSVILFVMVNMLFSAAAFAQISLDYGTESGQVAFLNQKNTEFFEEPYPLGPLSFKVFAEKFYIADSMGGKILVLNKKNELLESIKFTDKPASMIIEDIALVTEKGKIKAFWLIDSMTNNLVKVNKKGEKLATIDSENLAQPFRVEISASGRIYVADKIKRKIFAFEPNSHKLALELPWQWSGMALSPDADVIYRVFYTEESQSSFLVSADKNGTITKEVQLNLGKHFNSELWWVDESKQEFVMTYSDSAKHVRRFTIARVGFDGEIKGKKELIPPYVMNRYIDKCGNSVWLGDANYEQAPDGQFKIDTFVLP